MIGLQAIGVHIPDTRISNYDRKEQFSLEDSFIEEKLGITHVAEKNCGDQTSDLAVKAFEDLSMRHGLDKSKIECLVVVTQNPDYNLPHTSAIVHAKLDLPENCACFDISLGCSGYVYGLSLIESFMRGNNMACGVLITADPYSSIIDRADKNTTLLFGDAATASLISTNSKFTTGKYTFGTSGKGYSELICREKTLYMNGRSIYDFVARKVPDSIKHLLAINQLKIESVDKFIFHQGSRYMHKTILSRLKIDGAKAPFDATKYGNTVSSSIPILLQKHLDDNSINTVVICGFGVGLSWGGGVLNRK